MASWHSMDVIDWPGCSAAGFWRAPSMVAHVAQDPNFISAISKASFDIQIHPPRIHPPKISFSLRHFGQKVIKTLEPVYHDET